MTVEWTINPDINLGTVIMGAKVNLIIGLSVLMTLSACAVGPGTPLIDAMQPDEQAKSGTVQPPEGYGPPSGTAEAQGLINTRQRKETEAYLKSLASGGEAAPMETSNGAAAE